MIYSDTAPEYRQSEATARVACRNVSFVQASVADGCDPTSANGVLNPNEPAQLVVTIENPTDTQILGLWGNLIPFDEDVHTPIGGAQFEPTPIPGGVGAQATARFSIYVDMDQECPSTLRFRLELSGAGGFRDRAYFDVPLVNCGPGMVGEGPRPGEVPPVDTPGVSWALRVARPPTRTGNLLFTWDRAAGALRYNIWRGNFHYLSQGSYNHLILGPGAVGQTCNLPEQDPLNVPGLFNSQELLGEALRIGPPNGNFYYLVTAEADCLTGMDFEGPAGKADLDGDGTPDQDRPAGLLLDPACNL